MNILLVCNAGMSTGILQVKLQQQAAARGIEVIVSAVPLGEISDSIDSANVVLLGPQIRFAADDVRAAAPDGVPVIAIPPQDFGTMNAPKILDAVLAAVG